MHYERVLDTGDIGPTESQRQGRGHINPQGYRVIYVAGVRTLEHRHLTAQRIGRPLLPEETVHHKNGQRSDNRPGNLELWTKSQPPGQRVADKVAWAREILALYGEEF
jgi:hypothetical protein